MGQLSLIFSAKTGLPHWQGIKRTGSLPATQNAQSSYTILPHESVFTAFPLWDSCPEPIVSMQNSAENKEKNTVATLGAIVLRRDCIYLPTARTHFAGYVHQTFLLTKQIIIFFRLLLPNLLAQEGLNFPTRVRNL